jgi:hypothetical protein
LYNQRRSLVNIPKSERSRKTYRTTDRKIGMVSRQNPFWDAVKIKKEIQNVNLSVRFIRRRPNEIEFYGRKPAKKPFISFQNRRTRLQFAKEHLNWTPCQWKSILFSGETKFNLCSSDGIQWARRPKNERFNPKNMEVEM